MHGSCLRVVVFAAAVVFGCSGYVFAQKDTGASKASSKSEQAGTAEDPPLIDLAGYDQVLEKYRGKPLVVNFWATWCEPCRTEYPMVIELAKQFGPQGLAVVGVTLDDNGDLSFVRHFLAEQHPPFPNYRQKPGIDTDAFYRGVNPNWQGTMPATIFYGRDGHIARYLIGSRPRGAFEEAIRLILASPSARDAAARPAAGH